MLVQGGQRPEFHVTVDPARMLRAKTSIADIVWRHQPHQRHRFAGPAEPQPSAVSRAGHRRRSHSAEDIGDIVIKSVNNVPVRVQDVGDVAPAVEPVYTAVSANGKPAVLLSVNRQPDSNTVQVADEVHQEMAAIRPTLPAGVEMRPFYDQSNIVNESIASVRDAIIIGLFLAGLIIWLFLRDWGTAVMTGRKAR